MASNKQVLNVRYEDEDYAKLKCIALSVNRSMSNLVEYWSKLHIAEYEQKHGPISLSEDEEMKFKLLPGTLAAHREDNPMDDLPDEAIRSIHDFQQSFLDDIRQKPNNRKNAKKPAE